MHRDSLTRDDLTGDQLHKGGKVMSEILRRPDKPGWYWCRNVACYAQVNIAYAWLGKSGALAVDLFCNNRWHCCLEVKDSMTGEYIRIPGPDWPEPPKLGDDVRIVESTHGWKVIVTKGSPVGGHDDGNWCCLKDGLLLDEARLLAQQIRNMIYEFVTKQTELPRWEDVPRVLVRVKDEFGWVVRLGDFSARVMFANCDWSYVDHEHFKIIPQTTNDPELLRRIEEAQRGPR